MAGHGHGGQLQAVLQHRVDQDEAFHRALHQHPRIFFDQVRFAAMTRREVKIALLNERLLHSGQHLGTVAVAQLRHQHANRKRLLLAQRARIKAGPVIKFAAAAFTRSRVSCGMARTPGASFSTSDIVAGDRFRYSPRMRKLIGCPGAGSGMDLIRLAILISLLHRGTGLHSQFAGFRAVLLHQAPAPLNRRQLRFPPFALRWLSHAAEKAAK